MLDNSKWAFIFLVTDLSGRTKRYESVRSISQLRSKIVRDYDIFMSCMMLLHQDLTEIDETNYDAETLTGKVNEFSNFAEPIPLQLLNNEEGIAEEREGNEKRTATQWIEEMKQHIRLGGRGGPIQRTRDRFEKYPVSIGTKAEFDDWIRTHLLWFILEESEYSPDQYEKDVEIVQFVTQAPDLMDASHVNGHRKYQRFTMLHVSAEKCHIGILAGLLAAKADTEVGDRNKRRPVHYAAESDNEEVCRLLIQANADVTAKDRRGLTPAMTASECGFAECAQSFKDAEARRK